MSEHKTYSHKNQPQTTEEALGAMSDLWSNIAKIKTQLDLLEPYDFENDNKYKEWRNRAVHAACCLEAQLKYLERWLESQEMDWLGTLMLSLARAVNDGFSLTEKEKVVVQKIQDYTKKT